jgi:hypothetical protein
MATTKRKAATPKTAAKVAMTDSLTNLVSGLGTQRDKRTHNHFTPETIGYNWVELEIAYMTNWIAAQIVNVPVDDGLREWREFMNVDSEVIGAEEKRLNVRENYRLGKYWSRLFGGAIILMRTDQDTTKPLDVNKIKKGGLQSLIPLDRWDINPQEINFTDPTLESYLRPEYYRIINGQTDIHHSHVIRLDGEAVSRRTRMMNLGWGDSVLRRVIEDVKDTTATKGGIATLIQEANVDVVTRQGLAAELASGEEANILHRFAVGAQMKSFVNMLLLDGDETYDRKQISFSGLAQVMDMFMIWVSGAADIPMTRLFGRSAAGMNSTGEGDNRNYYDKVGSDQETKMRPELEKLDTVLIRSALGEYPPEYEFKWNPLYQESGLEMAQEDLAVSQSEDIRIQQGILKPSHIAMRLMQEGKYAITDDEIKRMQQKEKEAETFEREENDPYFLGGTEEGEESNLPE